MKIQKNQIVENVLPGANPAAAPLCRVIEAEIRHLPGHARLCFADETRSDAWLIANNRTWAAPHENIRGCGGYVYRGGLVTMEGGAQ